MVNNKILIIGGNGFIGNNLALFFLNQKKEVFSFDLDSPINPIKGVHYIVGDFFNDDNLYAALEKCDCVIHSLSTINPGNSICAYMRGYEKDFIQSVKVFEYCCKMDKQLIFLSSGGTVYGNQVKMPIQEDTLATPINHYGAVKLCIETSLRTFNRQNNKRMKIVRISNPYGPGQDYHKGVGFVDAAIKKTLNHEVIEIWGDGNVIRDYIYIEDVCKMIFSLLDYDGDLEVFNISSNEGVSQNMIIEQLQNNGYNPQVVYKELRSVDASKIILDNQRIKEIYKENILPFSQGIKKYLEYLIKQQ